MSKSSSESEGSSSMDDAFEKLLFESIEREKELQRQLNENKKINDELRLQLDVERMKIAMKGLTAFSNLKELSRKDLKSSRKYKSYFSF